MILHTVFTNTKILANYITILGKNVIVYIVNILVFLDYTVLYQ